MKVNKGDYSVICPAHCDICPAYCIICPVVDLFSRTYFKS